LLENRHEAVKEGAAYWGEKVAWKVWKQASLHRWMYNMGNQKMKHLLLNKMYKGWTQHRADLNFANKTFNEMWREKHPN